MDHPDPAEIAAITDPAVRAQQATEQLAHHQAAVAALARIRREAIAQLRASGLSYGKVAAALGVSRGRIAQLQSSHTVEREFFGSDVVTVTVPLRVTGSEQRPVIAQEDAEAAARLARHLDSLGFQTTTTQTGTEGEIDLSPPGLVLVCGPKSSPVTRELIERDPRLHFAPDSAGRWQLTDRHTGRTHHSPSDADPSSEQDIAYLARHTRPDGRPVLLIAGVHAIGSLGAVHHLTSTEHLHELHAATRGQNFSMIIRSTFTRSPLHIHTSEALTPPLLHDAPA